MILARKNTTAFCYRLFSFLLLPSLTFAMQDPNSQSSIDGALSRYAPSRLAYSEERQKQLQALDYNDNDLPNCHHYFLTQRFQGFITNAYSEMEKLQEQRDQTQNLNSEISVDKLMKEIAQHQKKVEDLKSRISIQEAFLESEKPESVDNKFILKSLEERRLIREEAVKDAPRHLKGLYEKELKETQEQIEAFKLSNTTYRAQISTENKIVEFLNDQITQSHNDTKDHKEYEKALEKFKGLADLKTRTVYNLSLVGNTSGSLFEESDVRDILRSAFKINQARLNRLDFSFLYNLFVSQLEFPDPEYQGNDVIFLKRYQDQIKELSAYYTHRLQEDVFSFDLVAPLVAPDDLELDVFRASAEELYKKIAPQSRANIFGLAQGSDSSDGLKKDYVTFGEILNFYGSESTKEVLAAWSKALFEDTSGHLLGQLFLGLKLESAFSWQKAEEVALHVVIRNKLRKNPPEDVSKEMMGLVHRILNRHMNWCALRKMGVKIGIVW